MQTTYALPKKVSRPLRAVIEIDGGEIKIFPVSETDADEKRILDALRFVREDFRE